MPRDDDSGGGPANPDSGLLIGYYFLGQIISTNTLTPSLDVIMNT